MENLNILENGEPNHGICVQMWLLTVESPAFIWLHCRRKWLGDICDIGDTVPSRHSTVKLNNHSNYC